MPIARIRNTDGPISRIRTTDAPTGRSRFSAILVPGMDSMISTGMPIGLLLALTYANDVDVSTAATFKGISPTARVRNTD